MVRIEGTPREISYGEGGALQHVVDLQVSTVAELPDKGDVVGGGKLMPGSIAQIIQTGAWYTLDDDGDWYDTDGIKAGSVSASVSASVSTRSATPPNIEPVVTRKFVPEPEIDIPEVVEDAKR